MGIFFKKRFPFDEPKNTAVITCCHVVSGKAILHVSHDEDGMWQFLCESEHSTEEARVVALGEIVALDRAVSELASMPCGTVADRESVTSAWEICKK